MIRLTLAAALLAAPAYAEDTQAESCAYQAQVVAAIQQARKDRVKEQDVPAAIAATNPTWPENYNAAIPLITPWVYEQKMHDIRQNDLAAAWSDLCNKR
ncbi:hypothetical protein ACFO5X_15190 [Seohaeicola nanhaiensis]|uniref:Uncharacterized protein n=1 Tax=Seohaeicola nanhaiensis TaxID=1387282 RepID=A0ABV9KIW4_9RHOB